MTDFAYKMCFIWKGENVITCKEYVKNQKELLAKEIKSFERNPKLCVIQIGDNAASNSYVKGKIKDCNEVGIECEHIHIIDYENFSQGDLLKLIMNKNFDPSVDGIIVQLPVPDKYDVDMICNTIIKEKDVDGFRKDSLFVPCTPKGVIDYLEYNNIELTSKICTVIGRSNIVGKPLVNLLIERGATVINCNSKTKDIKNFTRQSDIIISAIGKANYFDESYFVDGQVLIDVGINKDESGKLCGDICEEVKENMLLATPVPGGVGLLTRLKLLENTVEAYKLNQ